MTKRIGLAVDTREIRAAWVNRGKVRWYGSTPLSRGASIEETLASLFASAPPALRRGRLTIALSPAWVQVKRLEGLPKLKSPGLITRALRENHQSFFLSRGGPVVVADVEVGASGSFWGAAYNAVLFEDLVRASRARHLSPARVLPSVVALSAMYRGGTVVWRDGDELYRVETIDRVPSAISISGAEEDEAPLLPASLEQLGEEGPKLAAAYAAAVAPRNLPLCIRPSVGPVRARLRLRLLRTATGLAVAASGAFALLAPAIRSDQYVRLHANELAGAQEVQTELARDRAELKRVTQTLDRAAAFGAERGGTSRVLAALAQAIPESTAMLTFHVDSAEGVFTAIAPHVSDVLPELTTIDGVLAPRIAGSVTREVIGGIRVERATFRFRRPRTRRVIK